MLKRMLFVSAATALMSTGALADGSTCPTLSVNLRTALQSAVSTVAGKLGLGLNMWATVVAPDGHVCYVAYSGADAIQGQWLASRVISAQKAFTAATLSLGQQYGDLALSTANLYSAVQPGGSLFGLQHSNPVFAAGAYGDTISTGGGMQNANYNNQGDVATYSGPAAPPATTYGTARDPMIGLIIGGINVFGGGLALYANVNNVEAKVGGVGVSGDTSCTDHLIAWNLRSNLKLDHLGNIKGVSGDPARPDNIVFDITTTGTQMNGVSAGGFGHPTCLPGQTNSTAQGVANSLPAVQKP